MAFLDFHSNSLSKPEIIFPNCIKNQVKETKEIIISKFSEQTTLEDLRTRFSVYGNIKDCYLYSDSNEERLACITFYEPQNTVRAINDGELGEINLHREKLTVRAKLKNNKELQLYLENHRGDISIDKLNDDCILQIFRYLPVTERSKLKKVCKRWCAIINKSLQTVQYLNLAIPKLSLKTHAQYIDYEHRLQESFRNLREIQLSVNEALSECTDRTGNQLDNAAFLNMHLLAINGRDLTKLIIRSLTSNECIINHILLMNQELKHIAIYDNKYITGESLIYLSEQIHTLVIERCNFLECHYLYTALTRLKNLKCLRLADCCGSEVLNIFNKYCKSLESLELHFWVEDSADVNAWLSITNLKYLRDLRISSPRKGIGITDTFFVELSENCQNISRLELTGFNWKNIGEMGINAITILPKLQILAVRHFPSLEGFNNLHRLREFDCQGSFIREEQIILIMLNSPELRYLNILVCRNITYSKLLNILFELRMISGIRRNDVALEVFLGTLLIEKRKCVIYNGEIY